MTFKNIIWKYEPRHDGSCAVKIYCRVNGKIKYFQVEGVYVEPKYWDKRQGRVKATHPLHSIYNPLIIKLRHEVEKHFLTGGSYENFRQDEDQAYLTDIFSDYLQRADKGEVSQSKGTVEAYHSTFSRLKQFEAHSGKRIIVNEIDYSFQKDFIAFMRGQGVALRTIGFHFSRIKTRINTSGLNLSNDYYTKLPNFISKQKKVQVFLSDDEIKKIEQLKLSGSIERQRDRFLICYYFLLRFRDADRINRSSVIDSDGDRFLIIKAQKTGNDQVGFISDKADTLLEKYDYNFKFTANHEANLTIRKLAKMAGIDELIQTPEGPKHKHELINTHTARRSGATNMILQGASIKTVADVGGWSNFARLKSYLLSSSLHSAKLAKKLDHFK